MPEPAYDVIVVTWNHADTLPSCLRAVAALSPPPARVVVVDNASRDGSAELAEREAGPLPLTLLREERNTGFAAAANRALATSSSPWVLLLNPDCAPHPDFVARLLESAAAHPEAGSATGKLLRAEGAGLEPGHTIDAAGMVVTPSGRHLDRGAGADDDGSFERRQWVFGGTGAATLFLREALGDVAYEDGQVLAESFFAYREDAELAWRLQWRGWGCLYEPAAVAAHRRGLRPERGRADQVAVNLHSVKNRFLLRTHCADLRWHLSCLPWWLARDLLVVGACLTVERSSLPGLTGAWRLRGDALRRRRWVLERARVPSRRLRRWFRRRGWTEPVEVS